MSATLVSATAIAGFGGGDQRSAPSGEAPLDRGSAAIRVPDAADPRGGPPWAVKEFRTQDGRFCAKPGRRVGGEVGSLARDGHVVGAGIDEGGVCNDVEALAPREPIGWHVSSQIQDPRTGRTDPVSFTWGFARPEVERVTVETRQGTRTVPVSAGHTFIAVTPGRAAPYGVTLIAHLADGSERRVAVPPPSEDIRRQMLDPPQGPELHRALREAHPAP